MDDQRRPQRAEAIDWAGLEARYARRPSFVDRLTDVALSSMRDIPADLRALAGAGRGGEIAIAAHSLRTGADVIMAHETRDLAARVEAACQANAANAMALTRELADAVDLVVDALERRLRHPAG